MKFHTFCSLLQNLDPDGSLSTGIEEIDAYYQPLVATLNDHGCFRSSVGFGVAANVILKMLTHWDAGRLVTSSADMTRSILGFGQVVDGDVTSRSVGFARKLTSAGILELTAKDQPAESVGAEPSYGACSAILSESFSVGSEIVRRSLTFSPKMFFLTLLEETELAAFQSLSTQLGQQVSVSAWLNLPDHLSNKTIAALAIGIGQYEF